jgi:hypothetical protein
VNRHGIKGFAAENDLVFLKALVSTARRRPIFRKGANTAIGHWHFALLQLFLIVNQEIDQWRAAP